MTQWERAVEAAAKAIHQARYCNEAPNAIGEVEARWLNKEAAAALRAALPVLFEAGKAVHSVVMQGECDKANVPWGDRFATADRLLDAHRRALEAEASHD